jgi:hypothetical protein
MFQKAYCAALTLTIAGILSLYSCKKENNAIPETVTAKAVGQAQSSAAGGDTSLVQNPFIISSISTPVGRYKATDFGSLPAGLPDRRGESGIPIGPASGMNIKINQIPFTFSRTLNNDPVLATYRPAVYPAMPAPELMIEAADKNGYMKIVITVSQLTPGIYLMKEIKLTFDAQGPNGKPSTVYYSNKYLGGTAFINVQTLQLKVYAITKGTFDCFVGFIGGAWTGASQMRVSGSFNIDVPKF